MEESAANSKRTQKNELPGSAQNHPAKEETSDLRPLEVIPAEQNGKTILIRPEETFTFPPTKIVFISKQRASPI
jgi:hypothetical protein